MSNPFKVLECGCVHFEAQKITRHCLEHAPLPDEIKALLRRRDCGVPEVKQVREYLQSNPRLIAQVEFSDWLRAHQTMINKEFRVRRGLEA